MHIEFLLEEPSAEAALSTILSKIFSPDVPYDFHVFEGKHDLLKKLPVRLKGYRHWIPDDWRIVVLVDEDRKDCLEMKEKLANAAREAGFRTKSSTTSEGNFQVVNRLAVEELEAWFFGDPKAIRKAYPKISTGFQYQARYRNPDAIPGGTYEALERLLIRKNYYKGRLPKIEVAHNIAQHMEPHRNRSKSFQVFVEGLKACVGEESLV